MMKRHILEGGYSWLLGRCNKKVCKNYIEFTFFFFFEQSAFEELIVAQPGKLFSFCGIQNFHYICHRSQPLLAPLLVTSTQFALPN